MSFVRLSSMWPDRQWHLLSWCWCQDSLCVLEACRYVWEHKRRIASTWWRWKAWPLMGKWPKCSWLCWSRLFFLLWVLAKTTQLRHIRGHSQRNPSQPGTSSWSPSRSFPRWNGSPSECHPCYILFVCYDWKIELCDCKKCFKFI